MVRDSIVILGDSSRQGTRPNKGKQAGVTLGTPVVFITALHFPSCYDTLPSKISDGLIP